MKREGGWQAGRVEGWRGSLPQTQTQRSIPTSRQPLGWGLGSRLSLSLSLSMGAFARPRRRAGPPSQLRASRPTAAARETGVQTGPPEGVESGIACRLASPNLQATTAADDHTQEPGSP